MAGYGTMVQRPSAAQPSEPMPQSDEYKTSSTPKNQIGFVCPFNIPPTEAAAVARISKNFASFALYYALFVYIVLFITLIPRRKVSLVFLVAMREITFLYVLLLRALPNSIVLQKIIDKRFIFFLLSIITGVELILTGAAIHLLVTLASTTPIIWAHAILWKREDIPVNEECTSAGEALLPVTQNDHSDEKSRASV